MWPTPFSAYQVTLADPPAADSERSRGAQESLNSVDVRKYPFLDSQLAAAVRVSPRAPGYPVLDRGFESSVPGLHVVGAPAMESFGPLMRFVAGTGYAARAVTRRVAGAARAEPVAIVQPPAAWLRRRAGSGDPRLAARGDGTRLEGARGLTSRVCNGV
jgi:hypothetical protein